MHRLSIGDAFVFAHKNSLFPHSRFSTVFFAMKSAELDKIVLVRCIFDFDYIQIRPRRFNLNLNAYKVMKAFLIFLGQKGNLCGILFNSLHLSSVWVQLHFFLKFKIHFRILKTWTQPTADKSQVTYMYKVQSLSQSREHCTEYELF